MNLFSACLFGHPSDPVIVRVDGVTRFECRRCQADLGAILSGQKFKARKQAKPKKRKSAEVLHPAKFQREA